MLIPAWSPLGVSLTTGLLKSSGPGRTGRRFNIHREKERSAPVQGAEAPKEAITLDVRIRGIVRSQLNGQRIVFPSRLRPWIGSAGRMTWVAIELIPPGNARNELRVAVTTDRVGNRGKRDDPRLTYVGSTRARTDPQTPLLDSNSNTMGRRVLQLQLGRGNFRTSVVFGCPRR